jgi:hypothetical protein
LKLQNVLKNMPHHVPNSGPRLPLSLARACAWALLVAGWVGIGSLALQFAPTVASGFGGVALWLLALGAAATVATQGALGRYARAAALVGAAGVTAAALLASVRGGGQGAVLLALLGWAALTALASGVVRGLRLAQPAAPRPPITAASLGALAAALVLGDPGDLAALATRLALFVCVVTLLLLVLQRPIGAPAVFGASRAPPGCRAGLFDCSLPAWPAGAWREPRQWPVLLAGLAMLPMMAALPLMADWCRAAQLPPQALVLLHVGAMFGPAWLLQGSLARWSARTLALVCAALLAGGAAAVLWAPAPWDWLGLAALHGAAWGLAWGGQLWAPARRGQQGSSPLRAAAGYAVLTLLFGWVVEHAGARGVAGVHALLGLGAVLSLGLGAMAAAREPPAARAASEAPRSR